MWEDRIYNVTSCKNAVIKKIEHLNGKIFILVTGVNRDGVYQNPSKIRTVVNNNCTGIYMMDEITGNIEKVFGKTAEERSHIDHEWTDMSQNGKEIFFDYYKPGFRVVPDDVDNPLEAYKDYNVGNTTKYSEELFYISDKKRHITTLRTKGFEKTMNPNELIKWYFAPQEFYAEAKYTYLARGKTRSWLKPVSNKAVVVYPEKDHTYNIDKYRQFNKEVRNKGDITFYTNNIHFNNFNDYSNGILLYTTNGVIIGYYEFEYRVKDSVDIYWKPEYVLFKA